MPREWQPNGSHADYWRSDNPLIQGWWRFGNDLPKNAYLSPDEANSPTVYLSGLLKDSGPQRHHLRPWFRSGASDDTRLTPVASIAPWDPTGSGCRINWNNSASPDFLYVDPGVHLQNGDNATDHGTLGNGVNMYSGITVIGWAQIPSTTGTFTGAKTIVGRADQDTSLGTHLQWRVNWNESSTDQYVFQTTFLAQSNFLFNGTSTAATRVLQGMDMFSNAYPFFPTDRTQPFFFAVQFRREDVEANRSFTGNGSGIAKMWLGNAASGFTCFIERFYRGPDIDLTYISPDLDGVPLSIFGESRGLRNATGTTRHLPDGSVLDELVIVNDGFMAPERILHYALSGMTHVTTSDPERPEFTPEFPSSDGLVAYWDFDEDDGHNTAPPTLNDPRLEFSLSGLGNTLSFQDGIRGGRCIQVDANNAMINTIDGELMLARRDYPAIPAISGLGLLWPSGHVIDEGMTYIAWMRSVPTGTILGGGLGWYGGNGRHLSFASDSLAAAGISVGRNSVSVSAPPSGATALVSNVRVVSDDTTAATHAPGAAYGVCTTAAVINPEWDNHEDAWHLWAMVYDLKAGMIYLVKDAKFVFPMTQQLSSASGVNSNSFGPFQGFFGLVPRGTDSMQFDDVAVYNRILSLPEMSGFAINGIAGAPVESDIYTSFKSLVGYWPFNGFVNYDPIGLSGFRVDDRSWYSHHLTNISGLFRPVANIHSELSSPASGLQVQLSGSMVSLERVYHGNSFDASDASVFSTSGFAAGAWVYLPSGDLQTQGNGSSGLYGNHMIMGAWGESDDERSWFLGVNDNRLALKFVESDGTLNEFTSSLEPTYNAPFFVGCNFFPSGLNLKAQLIKIGQDSDALPKYGIDTLFSFSDVVAQPVGASGISFLNAPGRQWGFPSGTRIQHAFMHLGHLNEERWIRVKRDAINIQTLASGSVSVNDPENISHWKFDRAGKFAIDFGREQNHLFPINTDGHLMGVERAIHSSGAVIRQPEYLDTIPGNVQSKRLDLGSGTQSWTVLGWLIPPEVSFTDEHVILNKGSGPAASPTGIKIYTSSDSMQPIAIATGDISAAAQNGDLAPLQWNHLAVVYDRDNDEFGVVVNGRYAGTSFVELATIPVNNSGLSLGGRGDSGFDALAGGSAFSGLLDDWMMFSRALTLPEISGLAANSFNFNGGVQTKTGSVGMWISGIPQNVVSGMIGAYMHGLGQDIELIAGYISGVSGVVAPHGGFIHGRAFASGLTAAFIHGSSSQSGIFGHFIHGLDIVSGLIGSYVFGACEANDEFDVTLTFSIIANKDFDARLGVEKTELYGFDARLGVIRITQPPECTLEMPEIGLIASGVPYTLTVQGSGIAQDNKKIGRVRFTFADFKGAEIGTLVDGVPFSGLYEASRTFDTPGWYTVKIEVLDSYGYRSSCARPFLLLPSGVASGVYINSLPGIELTATPSDGSAIHRTFFTHGLSGLETTSGVLEYTDFADQQETLVNTLEMPSGTQFVEFVRTHDYAMPGRYSAVWAVSGSWGIVSDSLSDGIDYLT